MPSLYNAVQRISLGTGTGADFTRLLEDVLRRVALKHYQWVGSLGYDANSGEGSTEADKTHSDATHMFLNYLLVHKYKKSGKTPLQMAVIAAESGESADTKDKVLKAYLWRVCENHLKHLQRGDVDMEPPPPPTPAPTPLPREDIIWLADELLRRLS